MHDQLGDRMKMYENKEAGRRFIPRLPVYARIDGRTFSKFTKGMKRPYDEFMTEAMVMTTEYLVKETNACIGYTQSDEISLVWYADDPKSQIFFDGRVQKMTSQLAALASVKFLSIAKNFWPEKVEHKLPTFDARVYMLPTLEEAANCFVWREWDATKNSISMAAQSMFSHKALQRKNQSDMLDMMLEAGVNWNDYPAFFKRGTYVARRPKMVKLSDSELYKIKEEYRPTDGMVQRNQITRLDMPPITKVTNRVGVIFHGQEPIVKGE